MQILSESKPNSPGHPARRRPALLVSASASGQGKTTVISALARYYRNRDLKVRVFKTGPDFLDPMVLERAAGTPVYQLDPWMGGEDHCRQLLYQATEDADLILVEGVMGLFDGKTSSADLADRFHIPVLAIIDGGAMAQTFGAIAHGLASYRPGLPFAGVFANRVAGESHYRMLVESLPAGIDSLGWLSRDKEISLPERHLGLVRAAEIHDIDIRIDHAASALRDIDDGLPKPVLFYPPSTPLNHGTPLKGVRIAIACDAAFSFIYRANPDTLHALGADTRFFSPLADRSLPKADALYLPGGYPELHLDRLGSNESMKAAIRAHHADNKPIVAECGGMLYLLTSITDTEGHRADMVGLLPGQVIMQNRLANLGRHRIGLPEGVLRGHTFHYSRISTPLVPIVRSEGERPGQRGEPVYRKNALLASYVHLYFPSNAMATARLFTP
uniref:Cobyrinic acid a,c-diamide synthase n=1 Tax=Candidatus Kentrum sp. TC TaxID=2126339 RepID=A0A450ZPY0_9GAMM|nr:MAG: cobyrinic acid a,c-diamide synthase [Candidatus Kentron sp. TC]